MSAAPSSEVAGSAGPPRFGASGFSERFKNPCLQPRLRAAPNRAVIRKMARGCRGWEVGHKTRTAPRGSRAGIVGMCSPNAAADRGPLRAVPIRAEFLCFPLNEYFSRRGCGSAGCAVPVPHRSSRSTGTNQGQDGPSRCGAARSRAGPDRRGTPNRVPVSSPDGAVRPCPKLPSPSPSGRARLLRRHGTGGPGPSSISAGVWGGGEVYFGSLIRF